MANRNLALASSGATASADTYSGGNVPANAINGNHAWYTAVWDSGNSDNHWLQVDLGASYRLTRVDIYWDASDSAWEILTSSNGTDWTEQAALTSAPSPTTAVMTSHNISVDARYVRVHCTTRATTYGNAITELEVFGDDIPAPVDAGNVTYGKHIHIG